MQTRCPKCQTLYRIDEDVLKRAGGQARCFRCDTVFDALGKPPQQAEHGEAQTAPLGMTDRNAVDEPSRPKGAASPGEILEDAAGSALEGAQSPEFEDVPDLEIAPGAAEAAEDLPFQVPDDLPDIEPTAEHALDAERTLAPPQRPSLTHTLLPGLLGLLLIALALGQLAWFNRTHVLATPLGHEMASGICALIGCQVPPRRAPSQFAVLERDVGPDPQQADVLVMRLGFSNNADFAQPLPDIQLSLYDSQQKLMARRRLHPEEYLFPAPAEDTLVAPGDNVQVDVRFEDPGRHATGFKLEFM
jgi:predicted Zn finger-like uncharacterized protein